jgi:hypothetical protein
VVVSRWEKELDMNKMARILKKETDLEAQEPELISEGIPAPKSK